MAKIGDVVSIKGRRNVVMAFTGNGSGGRDVQCVRKSSDGLVQFVRSENGLDIIESPTFTEGDIVKVNGQAGTVVADTGGDDVRVQIATAEKPLTSDPRYSVELEQGVASVPRWMLVLENRL